MCVKVGDFGRITVLHLSERTVTRQAFFRALIVCWRAKKALVGGATAPDFMEIHGSVHQGTKMHCREGDRSLGTIRAKVWNTGDLGGWTGGCGGGAARLWHHNMRPFRGLVMNWARSVALIAFSARSLCVASATHRKQFRNFTRLITACFCPQCLTPSCDALQVFASTA